MGKVTITPKADWILFRQETVQAKTGIILPDDSKMKADMKKNIVVAKGDKATRVEIGDEIIILPQALRIDYPEREIPSGLMLIKDECVVAVMKEDI